MDSNDEKKVKIELDDAPVASTSKLAAETSEDGAVKDVKPIIKRSASPDLKGKRKAEDDKDDAKVEEDGDGVKQEEKEEKELDPNEEILLGSISKANLVGLKYAGGIRTLRKGLELQFRRDPTNLSDPNAIEVRHPGGLRIGFVARGLAARLSPLVKERKIRLTGTAGEIPPNSVGLESVPMTIEIHGQRKHAKDKRLDWLFPERREKKVEKEKQEKALKQAQKEREDGGEEGEDVFLERMKKTGPGAHDDAMRQSILLEQGKKPDLINDMFKEGEMDPANLPVHRCPPGKKDGSMRTNLLEFQKQGLAWMIKMEHPKLPKTPEDKPVQLWAKKKDVNGKFFWFNVVTETTQRDKPSLKRGGILADEMGLGKTMQTISLICTDDTGEGVLDEPEDPDERFDDMTLIVCPLSVASNWTDQFQQHVGKKRLSWHFYHGEGRELTKKQLREFDVVITTYRTLAGGIEDATDSGKTSKTSSKAPSTADGAEEDPNEFGDDSSFSTSRKYDVDARQAKKRLKRDPSEAKKKDTTLHAIKWRRVVLDEGHLIKNPKAKMSRACAELKAERRWILTGTPIINQTGDLGAMIHFLRMCKPLDDPVEWRKHVGKGGPRTAELLRAVVLSTTLRRTKDMVDSSGQPLIRLPKVSFYRHKVQLKPSARELYAEVEKEVAQTVAKSSKTGNGTEGVNITFLLCLLLRLRQLACDPTLCPAEIIADIRDRKLASRIQEEHTAAGGTSGVDQLPYLRTMLRDAQDEDCMACRDVLVEPRITLCQHIFCQSCIEQAVEAGQGCPQCGWALKPDQIIELPPSERGATPGSYSRASSVGSTRQNSVALGERTAKTEALIGLLKATPKGVKSLVFSQWTGHLDRIEAALAEEGIATCRFDGSMRQDKREEVIKLFTTQNKSAVPGSKEDKASPMVMLLSLKAGALGLNLTIASQVFLMDPWWQAAIEQQAIDRVNRIGQTKDIRVFQLVAEDTVESRVLDIQAKKEQMVAQAFSGSKNAPKSKEKIESKLEDLKTIFGITQ
ncbi:hypothetical protein JCM8547_002749 [Rhodosporidiobolus lusitaniae]